ncbi:DUF1579 family protein [Nannocystis pusilla]|uniref:DUF1579 family protein n=1 Tax=Nannocystis pusilla TaxID=889268 RepID=A0A9X3ETQ6_9BACT|nr:DUF1579 family protein [Nannocystis pusilla]MCY1005313.1 DUF1579 family protein [Nannocystis pusilla]
MAHPLTELTGSWTGPARTWLDPAGGEPDVGDWRVQIESLLEGRYARLRYDGVCTGKLHHGEMTLGVDDHEHTLYWIDTFHTGASPVVDRARGPRHRGPRQLPRRRPALGLAHRLPPRRRRARDRGHQHRAERRGDARHRGPPDPRRGCLIEHARRDMPARPCPFGHVPQGQATTCTS